MARGVDVGGYWLGLGTFRAVEGPVMSCQYISELGSHRCRLIDWVTEISSCMVALGGSTGTSRVQT